MSAADPTGSLCTYLASVPAVAALTVDDPNVEGGQAIYRPSLPTELKLPQPMPFAAIVIRRAGGYALTGAMSVPVGDPRVEFVCYANKPLEAERLAAEVVSALRALKLQPRRVIDGTRFYWARIESGPLPLIDPDEGWPLSVVVAQVAHGEAALA